MLVRSCNNNIVLMHQYKNKYVKPSSINMARPHRLVPQEIMTLHFRTTYELHRHAQDYSSTKTKLPKTISRSFSTVQSVNVLNPAVYAHLKDKPS